MTYIPPLRIRPKASFRKERSVPEFRKWIKRHLCSVKGCQAFPCDPAHIRYGLPPEAPKGGTGLKPHDAWIIPLCRTHHDEQHHGEPSFYTKYQIDANDLSQALWTEWLKTEQGRRYLKRTELVE